MKEYKMSTPNNTYVLSHAEIAVIHALCYYAPENMTKKADIIRAQLEEQFRMHDSIGKFKVWND